MCGITGGVSFTDSYFPTKEETNHLISIIKHRGPDDLGVYSFETGKAKVNLIHTRLSIIDLTDSGHQPMTSFSGRTCIVFNGEIYNYKILKRELEETGYKFKTHSDTEVILNSFECWGIVKMLNRIDGMFAFALFDRDENTLYLGRDRFGKKPLYYYSRNNQLAFSSDIRSFKKINGIHLSIDLHALGYFFAELSTPSENTIWNEVKKLQPGSYLKFDHTGISEYKHYWKLNYTESCSLKRKDIIENVILLLQQAVKKRLVADVNVGAMLSGGIDSSLIVAQMAQNTKRVKTYSVGFNEETYNELEYSRYVAKKFATDHSEIILTPSSLLNFSDLIMEFGEPFADSSMIPTYLISKEIAKSEKVVLGGDGGDELFAGYYSYYFTNKLDAVKQFSAFQPLAETLSQLVPTYRAKFLNSLLVQAKRDAYTLLNRNFGFNESQLTILFNEPVFFNALNKEHIYIWNNFSPNSKNDLINVLSASLKTRLLNDYLVKVDRASMYASLEMRSPFLDKDLAEFAATLKSEQLFHKTGTKSILKEIACKYFSRDFVHRNKMGFAVPLGEWFRGPLKEHLKEVVLRDKQKLVDLNYDFISKVIAEHCDGAVDHTHRIWSIYVFHIWAQHQ